MLSANRHEKIIDLINKDRFVKVSQLSKLFNVSEETIRRDLDKLEREGYLKKLHGGAVPVDIGGVDNIKPIMERIEENIEEKNIIAKMALDLINDGDTLILDSGSTMLQLAKLLHKSVTVITNDISIGYELSHRENVNLFMTGGSLRSKSFSLVGSECERTLRLFNVNKLFLSTSGIKLNQGLTTSNIMDASAKKFMINAADKVICLADHTKFDKVALVNFASITDLDMIVTDTKVDNHYGKFFQDKNIKVYTP